MTGVRIVPGQARWPEEERVVVALIRTGPSAGRWEWGVGTTDDGLWPLQYGTESTWRDAIDMGCGVHAEMFAGHHLYARQRTLASVQRLLAMGPPPPVVAVDEGETWGYPADYHQPPTSPVSLHWTGLAVDRNAPTPAPLPWWRRAWARLMTWWT